MSRPAPGGPPPGAPARPPGDPGPAGGPGPDRIGAGRGRGRGAGGLVAVGVLGALLGLALRGLVVATSLSATDSDEAVIALIALRAGRGDIDLFFWGQAYGGTIESLVAAPVFALLGPSVAAGRVLLVVLSGLAALGTWRVGRRLVGEPAAVVGAVLWWTTSSYFVWWSTKLNIYYGALCLALAGHLLLLRLRDGDTPRWWPAAFGLVCGAAVWANPQTLYLLVPAVLVTARPLLDRWRTVASAVPFAVVGAMPWLVFSVRNGWSTLQFPGVDVYLPYWRRVGLFFEQLPIAFGARLPLSGRWLVEPWLFGLAAAAVVAALAWGVVRRWPGTREVTALVFGYAALYGLSPQVGQPGARLQPRYLLFVTPVLALGLAAVVARVRWRRLPALGLAAVVVSSALSAAGLREMDREGLTLASGGPGATVPADIGDLLALLDDEGVRRAYSFYWLAYRVTFESHEEVIVAPAFAHISRFRPYAEAVEASPHPAVIAIRGSPAVASLGRRLDALGVPHSVVERGQFAVVVPQAAVDREQVAAAFREAGIFA